MKKSTLILLIALIAVTGCSFPGSSIEGEPDDSIQEPVETPSGPSQTPSGPDAGQNDPTNGIPIIPGAPGINTDAYYVADYESALEINGKHYYGPNGMAADIIQILMVSCTALDSYYSEEYGGSLFDLEPDVFDGDIALDAKAVARLRSGAAADGLPYIDPTFEYDGFAINTGKRTYTIWGSINSCIKPKEVGGSGETLYQTTFTDSDISLIIDVNGQRFSFVSDDLDMDVDSVEGTAMINGSICYIEFLLSVDSTPVYPDIIPPDPVVEQLSSIDFSA